MPKPKGKFLSSALSSSRSRKLPKLETYDLPRKFLYSLFYPSNKIIPTNLNIYLVTTYTVIEDGSDCGRIKRKGDNGKFLVQK